MSIDLPFVTKVFAALFAIMNPIANVPVFLSLTEGASDAVRRRVAATAALGTTIGCLVSILGGQLVLDAFGLSVDDFRLAGGLIVLTIALSMLQGSSSRTHGRTPNEREDTIDAASVAIYPLTIPLLVGPGTIATLIVYGHAAETKGNWLELAIGVGAFLALLTVALLSAPWLGRHLSATATAITRRLMGMILAAVAMEMMVTSLQNLFPGLSH
ncbi:MAG TPA: NAAT family transporter [Methylobacterium sp.]|jgi:multiple antibiotic resistance protein|uniref:MarC family protein n=1 Tax=Methylorubrum sp. B1-46 TaxID=2897334 RepID=UPI001E61A277|nr:NAAT family transporter [Methylorubrum sp. B1-46]UGB25958.1 NAAT family transporter [Methylorubrum sp. B1-46]HEV2541375.1 NAAT family transporter [Methylobacterium sp.]